jgi:hypothetical protein
MNKRESFYELVNYKGVQNLSTMQDIEEHRWRRQVWDKALNTKGE